MLSLIAAAVNVLLAAGVAQPAIGPRACGWHAPSRTYAHVVWIVLENHSYPDVIGSSGAPYLNRLANACGLATNFTAETHPSLPNYLAMTSGSTHGVHDDGGPASHAISGGSIFGQVNGSWRAEQESMPSPCRRTDSYPYAVRHDPALYYTGLAGGCATRVRPLGPSPDLTARFTFITPNLCHDMHDCSVSTGDAWLSTWVPRILATPQYRSGRTVLFITWDEDDSSHQNHIPTLVVGPSIHAGTRSSAAFDHYSLLRTTEELLGIRQLLGQAARATSMRPAFGL